MKNKKKIIFFLPSLNAGGAEKVFIKTLNFLNSNSKNQIFLLIINKNGNLANSIDCGVKIINLNKTRLLFCFFDIIKIIKKIKPDTIFTTLPHSNILFSIY